MKPYIGITDFANFEQVERMRRVFEQRLPSGSNRILHIGVMMSFKTLNGIPNRWQNVFPPKENIAEIFSSDKVYNCLHYADYDNNPNLAKNLAEAVAFGGANINALQLDMIWPNPNEITKVMAISPQKIEIILQIGKNALEKVDNDPRKVVEQLVKHNGVISRVLLDKSMGRGLGMDAKILYPFAKAISENYPKIGIGVAGGLGPDTLHLVEPLIAEFPNLSIDAEGRLRPSGNIMDPIDWDMAEKYLIRALSLF